MITPKQIAQIVEESREEAIQCLREIVQVPSVTGEEEAVSRVFGKWIEECGMKVERIYSAPGRPCLISEWFGSQSGKRFIFNGHMDVFPPAEGKSGKFGPWSAEISDGYLYGRGASDMKGGDCGALMAVRLLRRIGYDPKGSVVLSYMCDEENGGGMGVKYLVKQGLLKGDFGICMEPTCGKVLNRHWGILRMKFSYAAVPHHAGTPHPGVDALEKAFAAISRLYALDARLNKTQTPSGCPCLSVTMIRAGNTPNVQPGHAEFVVDRRLAFHETIDGAKAEILHIFDELKEKDSAYEYQYEILSDRPVLDIPDDDPFIRLLCRSYEQVMGKPAELYQRSGGSDAATLRNAYGISMPNFGVAEDLGEGGSGSPNERINIEDYLNSIKIYMMTVVNALSVPVCPEPACSQCIL